MADIAEAAEKKLKSRIRKLKKCNKDEEEKEKFFNQLGLSFTISLPTKNPEKQEDFIMLYTSPDGSIVHAEYAYSEGEEFTQMDISEKDLKVMDQTAATLCKDNHMEIIVFNMNEDGNILRAAMGEKIGTFIEN